MSSKTIPEPVTRSAWLMCEQEQRWTLHTYAETRAVTLQGKQGGHAYEFLFKCSETGAVRRWGTWDRRVFAARPADDGAPYEQKAAA